MPIVLGAFLFWLSLSGRLGVYARFVTTPAMGATAGGAIGSAIGGAAGILKKVLGGQ